MSCCNLQWFKREHHGCRIPIFGDILLFFYRQTRDGIDHSLLAIPGLKLELASKYLVIFASAAYINFQATPCPISMNLLFSNKES